MVSDEFIQLQNKLESLIKSFGRNYNFLLLSAKSQKRFSSCAREKMG